MANLETKYMGIELKNPIVAGACSLTADIETIKKLADQGAAALVVKSLFQEQLALEDLKYEQEVHQYDNLHPEMIDFFHEFKHAGPSEHIMWVRKAVEAVEIPVIASLNAFEKDVWVDYAVKLAETGVAALELNLFNLPMSGEKDSAQLEADQIDAVKAVVAAVEIPVSVKISPFYTNIVGFAEKLSAAGAEGLVLFNKMFQPDINIEAEKSIYPYNLSSERDHRLPLRYTGLLHGKIDSDICASTGILTAQDVIRMLLVGARCVQMVTALYKNGISSIPSTLAGIESWMDSKGYGSLDDFHGKHDSSNNPDKWFFDRSQYVRILMQGDPKI
jgi:dihydroorotate dehydrogenase (fumarate)